MSEHNQSAAGHFWRDKGWVFGLMIVAGIALGGFKVSQNQSAGQMARDGVDAIGTVTHKTNRQSAPGKTRHFSLSYSFAIPDDPYVNGMQDVTKSLYDSVREGGEITVRYIAADPSINVADPANMNANFGLALIAAAGLVGAGLFGGFFEFRRARRISGTNLIQPKE